VPVDGGSGGGALDAQLEEMMGDAPVCDVCGHITVRNGALLSLPELRQTRWAAVRALSRQLSAVGSRRRSVSSNHLARTTIEPASAANSGSRSRWLTAESRELHPIEERAISSSERSSPRRNGGTEMNKLSVAPW